MNDVAGPFHGVSGMQLARLLQLASPALPIGAYSYSSGLESALELGLVRDADSARRWLVDAVELVQGRFDAPLVAAACSSDDAESMLRQIQNLVPEYRPADEVNAEVSASLASR